LTTQGIPIEAAGWSDFEAKITSEAGVITPASRKRSLLRTLSKARSELARRAPV
jgi:hypothetical protein